MRVFRNFDFKREKLENRTVVIKNIPLNLNRQIFLEYLSKFGHIMKLEMPLEEKKDDNNKINLHNLKNSFFESIEKDLETNDKLLKFELKNKLNFYYFQINDLILKYKAKLKDEKLNLNLQKSILSNLLVEIRFFMQKFFPKQVLDSLLNSEFEKIYSLDNIVDNGRNNKDLKVKQAYETIIANLENLIAKHEDKLQKLAKPLTREEVLIDLKAKDKNYDPESKINL